MDSLESEGATVAEAVEAALRQMGRREDEVDVEVLSKGSRGIFGLGVRQAKVRVSLKGGGNLPPEAVERAKEFLVRIIKLMGMDVEVEAHQHSGELYLEADQGAGGILIGRRGSTLAALSTIMERVVNRGEGTDIKVFVDVAGYLERRRRTLVGMANRVADEVKNTGHRVELEPMSAFERKVIHTALHHEKAVRTYSLGEGSDRRVVVVPADSAEGEEGSEPFDGAQGRRGERDDRGFRGRGPWRGGRGGRGGGRGFRGRGRFEEGPPNEERGFSGEGPLPEQDGFAEGEPGQDGRDFQEGGPSAGAGPGGERGGWRGDRGGYRGGPSRGSGQRGGRRPWHQRGGGGGGGRRQGPSTGSGQGGGWSGPPRGRDRGPGPRQ